VAYILNKIIIHSKSGCLTHELADLPKLTATQLTVELSAEFFQVALNYLSSYSKL
jgi:hypothetical protein